jgi:D-lactate dehydrogenase (cytochrome)
MNAIAAVRPERPAVEKAIGELTLALGNRVVTSRPVREQHGNTTTWIASEPPDAVVYPLDSKEIQQIVMICSTHGVPIIPFGAGTSFEGHVNAPLGGVCIDFKDLNRVLAVNTEDFDCVVEPGITRTQLNDHLRDLGLFFPVDPGADAALGGMASTRASGTTAVRYGTMKDNVLALKAVLPNGKVISTGQRSRKSAAGYDLTRLFVGAEGTLGVITELTLKLHAIPEATAAGICPFPSIKSACDAAIAAIQMGIPMARIELMDEVQVRICNTDSKLGLPECPMLFVEFHGTDAGVAEQSERFGEIARDFGGGPFEWATKLEDRTRLWKARHHVFWANRAYRPGSGVVVTDVCVPISRLAECLAATREDIDASGFIAPLVGHVGDGNFHACVLVKMDDAGEVARAKELIDRIALRALDMEGTCTGEHGIGQGKKKFLALEHGEATVNVMRAIKHAFDPKDLMNPGKIV